MTLQNILMVGVFGFVGTIGRFLTVQFIGPIFGSAIVGTFVVNILGSLAIGCAYGLGEARLGPNMMTLVTVGLLGGFTTFSAFSIDAVSLLKDGRFAFGIGYILLMVIVCLVSTYFGLILTKPA